MALQQLLRLIPHFQTFPTTRLRLQHQDTLRITYKVPSCPRSKVFLLQDVHLILHRQSRLLEHGAF